MKSLRYILPFILSLLIIYTGVGVAICSCMTCVRACICCDIPCDDCHDSEQDTVPGLCEEGGCSISIFKVNLIQQTVHVPVSLPSFDLFCELLFVFKATSLHCAVVEVPYVVPPNPESSRHYLAFYSRLLI